MEQKFNNELIGISAEIAIAETFDVGISDNYRMRGDEKIINLLKKDIFCIFTKENIPFPSKHVAEGQNSIDFILKNKKTLSVKTNKRGLGKVAPQKIGQPSLKTYFSLMKEEFPDIVEFNIEDQLKIEKLCDTDSNRIKIFKKISINYIDILLSGYWKNLVDCDYLLLFYNIVDKNENVSESSEYIVLRKEQNFPNLNKENISFTKTLNNWNESNTVKYNNNGKLISIAEFQAHSNRGSFKFRFNIKNILKILNS